MRRRSTTGATLWMLAIGTVGSFAVGDDHRLGMAFCFAAIAGALWWGGALYDAWVGRRYRGRANQDDELDDVPLLTDHGRAGSGYDGLDQAVIAAVQANRNEALRECAATDHHRRH